jgi:hypothetical protein
MTRWAAGWAIVLLQVTACDDDAASGSGAGGGTGATTTATSGEATASAGSTTGGGASAGSSGPGGATTGGSGGASASSGCEGGAGGASSAATGGAGGLGGAAANCDDHPDAIIVIDPPECATTIQLGDPIVIQRSPYAPDKFISMVRIDNGHPVQSVQEDQPNGTTELHYELQATVTYQFTAGWFCNVNVPGEEQAPVTAKRTLTAVP